MLDSTGLAFIKNMKAPLHPRRTRHHSGDFSADAIAKDIRLMLDTADKDLPAARAALASLEDKQRAGHGDEDFSVIFQ